MSTDKYENRLMSNINIEFGWMLFTWPESIRPLLLALSTTGMAKSAGVKAEFLRFDCYILGLNFVESRPKDRPTLRSSSVGIPCLRSRRNEIFMIGLHGGIRASAYVLMHKYARWPLA